METRRRLVCLGLLGLVACAAGRSTVPAPVLGTTVVEVAGVSLTVEVADTPDLRERGLMERSALRPDHGMVFVYPDERQRSFWMKNTPLPLSIAYIDSQGRIVHMADMTPFDTSPVPSRRPAMYAIEVEQGWFDRKAVRVGDKVEGLPPPSSR